MIHRFRFEVEGVEMPFQAFSMTVGERVGEAVVSVPPLSAFFHLPPGTYARLVFLDDALKKEVVLFDGVLVGAGLAKSATGMTVDLRFVDPLRFVFPFPIAALSITSSSEEMMRYAKLTEFLLQRIKEEQGTTRTLILSGLTELSAILDKNASVGQYVRKLMEVVFGASDYTDRIAKKFSSNSRYKVLAEGRAISDFARSRLIFEYLLKYTGSVGPLSVGDYFERFLDVVRQSWYYQAVFLGGANVLVVPRRSFFVPPKTNVFAPCTVVTMDLSVDHTTPTRALVTIEAGDILLYQAFPRNAAKNLTTIEVMRGVWPDFVFTPIEEFLASVTMEKKDLEKNLEDVAAFFAKRQLYERYVSANTGSLKTPFYPYALVGLPAIVLTPAGHYAGVLVAARHEYTVEGNAASFFTLAGVLPASVMDRKAPPWLPEAYRRLGTRTAEGSSVAEAAKNEYALYEKAVAKSKKSDEAKFWAWYVEHAPLNTAPPVFSGFDEQKRAVVSKIKQFLDKYPIATFKNVEALEKQVKGKESLVYPTELWLEGSE